MRQRLNALAVAVTNPRFDLWLVPIFLVGFALSRAGRFEERDPYWEARAGMENLAGWPLARPDSWTWSGVEGPWFQNSPLWNTLLGAAYSLGGFWGLYVLTALAISGYFLVAYVLAQRLGARRLPALLGVMASAAPALSMLSPRATIAVQTVILGSILLVVYAVRSWAPRWPTWAAGGLLFVSAAALSVFGNWLHLSFLLFSVVMAGAWAIVIWLAGGQPARRLTLIVASTVGWLLGPLLSPYGLAGGLERTRVVQAVCDGLILEWTTPLQLGISPVFWLMTGAATVLAVASTVAFLWTGPLWSGWSAARSAYLVVLLIAVPSAMAGWYAIRFLGISLLTIGPAVSVAATIGVDALRRRQQDRPPSRWREYSTGGLWRVVLAGAMVLLSPGAVYLAGLHAVPDELTAVQRIPQDCRLFSSGGLAATVILTRPDVQVWIDGRADFFGRDYLIQAYRIFGSSGPAQVPKEAQCVLIDTQSKDSIKLNEAMASAPQWRLVSDDGRYRMWLPA